MRPSARLVGALGVGVLIGMSCQFTFDDSVAYACKTDLDCGYGGYACTAGVCCRAAGEELCGDGVDNDCDGHRDGHGAREECNGRDDDCDGETDEGFDLQFSPADCGACGVLCDLVTEHCNAGKCELRPEIDCNNGLDEDQNGAVDCADQSCNLLPCGEGCLCKALKKAEVNCADGLDSDGDGALDCADPDCASRTCGGGCTCLELERRETDCFDHLDNDGNGETDCADPNCGGLVCVAGSSQTCSRGECLCNGRGLEVEQSALCGDGVDNDCDELTDCGEPGCDGQTCSPDGGAGCTCVGTRKAERSCENLEDDDGDGLIDCADTFDCPERSACTGVLTGFIRAGACGAIAQCITEFCFDGADNDGDAVADCADPDCFGASCQADGGLAPDGGAACLCVATVKVEAHCGDRTDNDGDGLVDCSDVADCPAGTPCIRASNGQPGLCQASNHACN